MLKNVQYWWDNTNPNILEDCIYFFCFRSGREDNFLYQARNVWQFNIIALEIPVQVLILQNKTFLEIVLEKKKYAFLHKQQISSSQDFSQNAL